MDFEAPLTSLVWITSIVSIIFIFIVSNLVIGDLGDGTFWWKLSLIISCGTTAGAIIPEVAKIFTSVKSDFVQNVVTSSRYGGVSLNVLQVLRLEISAVLLMR
ncbi:MAG: sodium/proton-translocating pyrophosphatase [Endomicrobium sp.]|nr:sodium/proton-translocating pyrophosphatase [Endomicrobium sp.]